MDHHREGGNEIRHSQGQTCSARLMRPPCSAGRHSSNSNGWIEETTIMQCCIWNGITPSFKFLSHSISLAYIFAFCRCCQLKFNWITSIQNVVCKIFPIENMVIISKAQLIKDAEVSKISAAFYKY